ncbi:hypothetical protein CDAR_183961 [Caerostris darwini]|uniref:Uncharacterized protein n=1 Tax=Caerostris darwini TaxID=1538125 RepID=A0AAV4TXG5_9ARAC|nr:hypothetical protein CDAR_183961 [Caerostris darwini]
MPTKLHHHRGVDCMLGLHHFVGEGWEFSRFPNPLFSFREEINEVVCYPQSEAAFPPTPSPADKSSVSPSDEHATLAAGQTRRKHFYRLQRIQSKKQDKTKK